MKHVDGIQDQDQPAMQINHLSKKYPSFALNDISLLIPKGYITGLIGPNGAGKSTLIRSIMGMIVPDSGQIVVNGRRLRSDDASYKEEIGFVSDENIFYEYLTLNQIIRMTSPFYKRWNSTRMDQLMRMFELPGRKKLKDCSKGMKMKFSIAMAMAHDPRILILDEPTAGLDPVFRRELLQLLSDFIQDETRSILFSTHNTDDLDRIADYITFIHRGRIVFSEGKDEIIDKYVIVKGSSDLLDPDVRKQFTGLKETPYGFEALSANRESAHKLFGDSVLYERPALEDIMYYTSKGDAVHESYRSPHS
ncbi:ABC transporter ATP-binding protein [Priestia sp. BR_2]